MLLSDSLSSVVFMLSRWADGAGGRANGGLLVMVVMCSYLCCISCLLHGTIHNLAEPNDQLGEGAMLGRVEWAVVKRMMTHALLPVKKKGLGLACFKAFSDGSVSRAGQNSTF